jgi:hypothetical protein
MKANRYVLIIGLGAKVVILRLLSSSWVDRIFMFESAIRSLGVINESSNIDLTAGSSQLFC